MNNAQITTAFLSQVDPRTRKDILASIAAHYGINEDEAFAEVTDTEAESLLDYLTGSIRTATSLLFKRLGF